MDKYYIPEIEEFHKGFEYELQCDEKHWLYNNTPYDFDLISNCIVDNRCRVKHLDKADIESLEFTVADNDPYWYDYKNDRFYMYKESSTDKYWNINDNESDIGFRGVIKNKSELKRLLKQLNIIE